MKGNRRFTGNVLPVGQIAVSLGRLSAEVGQMAGEEEVVRGSDGEGVAHEGSGVDGQGGGHRAGDTVQGRRVKATFTCIEPTIMGKTVAVLNVHLRVLLGVHHSRNGDTEVGDRAPEVCAIMVSIPSYKQIPSSSRLREDHSIPQDRQSFSLVFFVGCKSHGRSRSRCPGSGKLGADSERTGRADIVRHLVGADLGVDSLDSSSHDELLEDTRGK